MLIFHFWATFGGKMGVATTHAPYGLGPPNQRVGPQDGPFGPTAISESCFRNFQGWHPPLINDLPEWPPYITKNAHDTNIFVQAENIMLAYMNANAYLKILNFYMLHINKETHRLLRRINRSIAEHYGNAHSSSRYRYASFLYQGNFSYTKLL